MGRRSTIAAIAIFPAAAEDTTKDRFVVTTAANSANTPAAITAAALALSAAALALAITTTPIAVKVAAAAKAATITVSAAPAPATAAAARIHARQTSESTGIEK